MFFLDVQALLGFEIFYTNFLSINHKNVTPTRKSVNYFFKNFIIFSFVEKSFATFSNVYCFLAGRATTSSCGSKFSYLNLHFFVNTNKIYEGKCTKIVVCNKLFI